MRTIGYIASGVIVGSSLVIASSAIAGGFSLRQQSTTGTGLAYADSAAGTNLSSMYWNPAAVTALDGTNTSSNYSLIIPNTEINMDNPGEVGITKDDLSLMGASYVNYQLNKDFYVGLSFNAPAGVATNADPYTWQGDEYFQASKLLVLNAAPTIGYKITPEISVAAGLQVEYMYVRTINQIYVPGKVDQKIVADDLGFGFTLGALYKSETTGTNIGIGYRSAVKHSLQGYVNVPGVLPHVDITADYTSPQMVTASIRQELTPNFAVMANVEWTDWSVFEDYVFKQASTGAKLGSVQYDWDDGWYVSFGAELKMSEKITGRAGIGFERSPVTDAERGPSTPDSDRIWLGFGASYKWSESMTLDFAYSHIFFKDADISLTGADQDSANFFDINANVDNSADIISIGLRSKW